MHPADENDTPVFVGRLVIIGAISLPHLLFMLKQNKKIIPFFDVLDYYLNLIRKLHLRTYDYLGEMKASVNPSAYPVKEASMVGILVYMIKSNLF